MIEYLKNNIPLLIVFVLIIALIIVLAVLLIRQLVRKKKTDNTTETVETQQLEEATVPEPEFEPEPEPEPEPEAPVSESVETQTETIMEEETMKQPEKEEKKPVKAEPKKTSKPAKPAPTPVAAPIVKSGKNLGKWVIFEEDRGGFGFRLMASNGEQMLKSSSPYASISSAKSGIKTYQDNIAAGRLEINQTKNGNFFVQINNASNRLLATSADYKTRSSCESAADSIKRWAPTTVIVVENDEEPDKK